MSGQRGSVLAGVMAMSLVMTLAAGGFILMVANTAKDDESADRVLQLHYAAEGGLQTAVRLMRSYDSAELTEFWPDGIRYLTKGGEESGVFIESDDDILLRVALLRTPGSPGSDSGSLKAWATAGPNRDTLVVTWQIDGVSGVDSTEELKSRIYLSNWQETVLPGMP